MILLIRVDGHFSPLRGFLFLSFSSPEKIATGVHRDYDPVLGDDRQCVIWYGDLSEDDHLPVIRMVKPGESQESQTYVNRTLVFLYAGTVFQASLSPVHLLFPFVFSCPARLRLAVTFRVPIDCERFSLLQVPVWTSCLQRETHMYCRESPGMFICPGQCCRVQTRRLGSVV